MWYPNDVIFDSARHCQSDSKLNCPETALDRYAVALFNRSAVKRRFAITSLLLQTPIPRIEAKPTQKTRKTENRNSRRHQRSCESQKRPKPIGHSQGISIRFRSYSIFKKKNDSPTLRISRSFSFLFPFPLFWRWIL